MTAPEGAAEESRRRRGSLGATIFLGIFLLVGLAFSGALVWAWLQALGVWFWDRQECVIESTEIRERPGGGDDAYRLEVRFRYLRDGRQFSGDEVALNYDGSDDAAETQRLADRYPSGSTVECWVDPDDASRAFLRRPSLWFGFFILVPLVFVAVGGGGIYFVRRREKARPDSREVAPQSISQRAKSKGGWGCGLVSLIFFLAGAGFSLFFVIPAVKALRALSWDEVPCEVLHSSVASHSSDDGTTYSVEVLYRYTVEGREYRSSRYRFLGGSSSGYESKAAVVERLPAGTETTCWVNPDDPYEAVLDRGLGWEFLFVLLPLVFVGVGGAGLATLAAERWKRRAAGRGVAEPGFRLAEAEPAEVDPYRPRRAAAELEPEVGRFGKLVGLLFIAAFWNGIVGLFLYHLVSEWRSGNQEWFLALFLTPFVLVGLALLVSVPYQFLALFNPRPHLLLEPGSIPLGGSARLSWRFSGAAGRLSGLKLRLVGSESATYRRGTTTTTDSEVFHDVDLLPPGSFADLGRGSVEIEIPEDVMHSFEAPNNKVEWEVKLEGEIRFWPDVSAEFPIHVVPPEGDRR